MIMMMMTTSLLVWVASFLSFPDPNYSFLQTRYTEYDKMFYIGINAI